MKLTDNEIGLVSTLIQDQMATLNALHTKLQDDSGIPDMSNDISEDQESNGQDYLSLPQLVEEVIICRIVALKY